MDFEKRRAPCLRSGWAARAAPTCAGSPSSSATRRSPTRVGATPSARRLRPIPSAPPHATSGLGAPWMAAAAATSREPAAPAAGCHGQAPACPCHFRTGKLFKSGVEATSKINGPMSWRGMSIDGRIALATWNLITVAMKVIKTGRIEPSEE